MLKRVFLVCTVLFLIPGLLPAKKKRPPLDEYVHLKKGSGKPVTAYRYFRNIADAAGGIAVVSSRLFENSDPFTLPEIYDGKSELEDIVKRFCRLFPVYRYRFIRSILNVYPVKSMDKIRGKGRLCSPDEWITRGAALVGEKRRGIWVPAAGHTRASFRVPLFRKIGEDSIDAAIQFCRFYPVYDFRRRGGKIYIFPRGEWPRVARKYNEPLIQIDNGFTVIFGRGAFFHGGYIFRFGRFFAEPRIGLGQADQDDDGNDSRMWHSTLNGGWFFLMTESVRMYAGLSFLYMRSPEEDINRFKLSLMAGVEFSRLFGECALTFDAGKPIVRLGAGWRF